MNDLMPMIVIRLDLKYEVIHVEGNHFSRKDYCSFGVKVFPIWY